MKLYFVRHGKAQTADGSIPDHDRQLTTDGAARMQAEARVMARLGIKPDRIYSSPRVRALQTAEIIGKAVKTPVEIREEVNFDFDMSAVKALTQGLANEAEIMFVGHNPSMEVVLHQLTGADVMMKVGSLARVDTSTPNSAQHGYLIWLIAPRVFDALAK